jgi:hypothetical protein
VFVRYRGDDHSMATSPGRLDAGHGGRGVVSATSMPEPTAVYRGDGVYVVRMSQYVEVYTHNGIVATNRIYLDGVVLAAFLKYLRQEGLSLLTGET